MIACLPPFFNTLVAFRSTPENGQRILAEAGRAQGYRPLSTVLDEALIAAPGSGFWYRDGVVQHTHKTERTLLICFPEYSAATPCLYEPHNNLVGDSLLQGDKVDIYGVPESGANARPDFPPMLVRVIDFSNVRRTSSTP